METTKKSETGRPTEQRFDTKTLAEKYCKVMALTSRNTTGWHAEERDGNRYAVGQFKEWPK